MRITYITAGAGGMICGSCIRDNALARALIARGHDVTLLPLYTPIRTDEPSVSRPRVFFGGISVYLEQYLPLFRHTPWIVDRLWESPWLLRAVSGRGISTRPEQLGELTVSVLEGDHGRLRKEFDKLAHWLRAQPRPDLIDISNSLLIALARPLKGLIGCPLTCTLQGEHVFLEGLVEPFRARARALVRAHVPHVDRFVAVSDFTAAHMSRYLGIPGAHIDVVPLGVTLAGFAPRADAGGPYTIGYFGRVAPEKGLHLVCEAYRRLWERGEITDARLEIAGYLGPEHRSYWHSLEQQVRAWGIHETVAYRGVLGRPEKIRFLQSLDVLVVPALYDDPKGLALLEAMASGVPVVAARRGTYVELLERTGGGVLVAPDDLDALTAAIGRLHGDRSRARELGRRGAAVVREHYSADAMAAQAEAVYARLHARTAVPLKA